MSRIPTYAYRCVVINKPVGAALPHHQNHNYTNLAGAFAMRDIALRRSTTKRVEIVMVLDESTPTQKD